MSRETFDLSPLNSKENSTSLCHPIDKPANAYYSSVTPTTEHEDPQEYLDRIASNPRNFGHGLGVILSKTLLYKGLVKIGSILDKFIPTLPVASAAEIEGVIESRPDIDKVIESLSKSTSFAKGLNKSEQKMVKERFLKLTKSLMIEEEDFAQQVIDYLQYGNASYVLCGKSGMQVSEYAGQSAIGLFRNKKMYLSLAKDIPDESIRSNMLHEYTHCQDMMLQKNNYSDMFLEHYINNKQEIRNFIDKISVDSFFFKFFLPLFTEREIIDFYKVTEQCRKTAGEVSECVKEDRCSGKATKMIEEIKDNYQPRYVLRSHRSFFPPSLQSDMLVDGFTGKFKSKIKVLSIDNQTIYLQSLNPVVNFHDFIESEILIGLEKYREVNRMNNFDVLGIYLSESHAYWNSLGKVALSLFCPQMLTFEKSTMQARIDDIQTAHKKWTEVEKERQPKSPSSEREL